MVLVVQYQGVVKVNLWDFKGNILTQKRLKVTYSTTKWFLVVPRQAPFRRSAFPFFGAKPPGRPTPEALNPKP